VIRKAVILGLLVFFWLALWEDLSFANVVGGVLAATVAMALAPVAPRTRGLVFRPLPALHLTVYFAWQLIVASIVLAWEVVTPRNRINEAVVAVPLHCDHPFIVTLVANSVSLVPGTLTLEARLDPPTLYVHVLHLKSVEEVRVDLRRFEALAVRALVADRESAMWDAGEATRLPMPEEGDGES
jgi:multicomponent Na+:H+ antiporter subunit E